MADLATSPSSSRSSITRAVRQTTPSPPLRERRDRGRIRCVGHELTLGQLERRGDLSGAEAWEGALGPGWRNMTARHAEAVMAAQRAVVAHDFEVERERRRFLVALTMKFEQGRNLEEAVVGEVLRELYREQPPLAVLDAAVTTLAN